MAYFPKIDPFYDPGNEQHKYNEQDGRLRLKRSEDAVLNESSQRNHSRHSHKNVNSNQDKWNNVGSGRDALFYTEARDNAYSSAQDESAYHSRQASYQSVSSHHSSNSDSPRQNLQRQGSHSSNKSEQFCTNLANTLAGDQFHRNVSLRQSDQTYEGFSRNLNTQEHGPIRSSQRVQIKTTSNGLKTVVPNYSQSGKRKSVYMNPNTRHVDNVSSCHGVELCEKLFGIKLCHYKQKPPRPNGASVDQVLRDRKVIVQGVVDGSQADICNLINRGDMLVAIDDKDLSWVNIDNMFQQVAHLHKVKLTFQVPVVVGPKSATPPVTPTRCTPPPYTKTPPPIPPHVPLRIPLTLAPSAPAATRAMRKPDLISLTTGETKEALLQSLGSYMFAFMYLTLSGQSDNSKADVIYQYPELDNKLVDIRGLFLTLAGLLSDVTQNVPKMTSVMYRGLMYQIMYWKCEQDLLTVCLPENRVPSVYLSRIFNDLLRLVNLLYGSVQRVFRDREFHDQLTELMSLTLYRVLHCGVDTKVIPYCNPQEPRLMDTLTGVRWLKLTQDDKTSCDEILNEFEAQEFLEFEDYDSEERRKYGLVGCCLFYRDYLLCSHLSPESLQDVHLYLKYHCILHLVSTRPADDVLLWHEIYPTHLCHTQPIDNPGYREPKARWFLLVISLRHFVLCTVLEAGSYSQPVHSKAPMLDEFLLEQCKATLAQLDLEDTDMELQCNERLFSETFGPGLRCIDSKILRTADTISPLKGSPSPRYNTDDSDRISSYLSPNGPSIMKRQGSKLSYGSNDSSGSSNSLKVKFNLKNGSAADVDRSFSVDSQRKATCDIKLTRGLNNSLLHYVSFDKFEALLASPTPCDLAAVQGPSHQHVLCNFYAACLRIHDSFDRLQHRKTYQGPGSVGTLEEGVMFTCTLSQGQDPKRQPISTMYWVIGRRYREGQEMFVCLEDGAPQSLLELAFAYNFGLT